MILVNAIFVALPVALWIYVVYVLLFRFLPDDIVSNINLDNFINERQEEI